MSKSNRKAKKKNPQQAMIYRYLTIMNKNAINFYSVFFSIKKAYCISVRAYDTSIEVKDQTNEGRNTTGD